jgi:ribonuclease HI
MKWHIYVDGASSGNPGESGAGIAVFGEDGQEIRRESIYLGRMTNNMAEYEAFLLALGIAHDASVSSISVYTDSELVAKQITGEYRVKNERLSGYVRRAMGMIGKFDSFSIQYVSREVNRLADKLAKSAANKGGRRVVAPVNGEESPDIKGPNGP